MTTSSSFSEALGLPSNRQPLGESYLPSAGSIPIGFFFLMMANGRIAVRTTRGRRPSGSRWISVAANGQYFQAYYRGGQTRYVPESKVIATFGDDYLSVLNEAIAFYFQKQRRLRRRHNAACREAVRLSREIAEADNYARVVTVLHGENHEYAVAAQARVVALREQLASVKSQRDQLQTVINQPITTPVQVSV